MSCADDRNYNTKNVDRLSSLEVAEKLLYGALVKHRPLLIKLALNTAIGLQAFQKGQLLTLSQHLKKIELLRILQDKIKYISEISCMYWHRVVFPLFFKNYNKQHKSFNGLSVRLLNNFCNVLKCLIRVVHLNCLAHCSHNVNRKCITINNSTFLTTYILYNVFYYL